MTTYEDFSNSWDNLAAVVCPQRQGVVSGEAGEPGNELYSFYRASFGYFRGVADLHGVGVGAGGGGGACLEMECVVVGVFFTHIYYTLDFHYATAPSGLNIWRYVPDYWIKRTSNWATW